MKVGIIYGGADGVFEQAQEAMDLVATVEGAEIVNIAVNDAGADLRAPRDLHHWVSLHPDKLVIEPYRWAEKRNENCLPGGYVVWSTGRYHSVVDRTTRRWTGGSSGLLAVDVADRVGCDRIILCGVPIDGRQNTFRGKAWDVYERFRPDWIKHGPAYGHFTRSMSGWTADILGLPTLEWLTRAQWPHPVDEYKRREEAARLRKAAA